MIHIIITVQPGPRPAIVVQEFVTKLDDERSAAIGRLLLTLIRPFLQEVARRENASFRSITSQPSKEVATRVYSRNPRGQPKKEPPHEPIQSHADSRPLTAES